MTWNPLLALSARWIVPLLFALAAIMAIGVIYQLQVKEYSDSVQYNEQKRLRERLGVEQTRLEHELGQGNLMQVRRLVSGLALHSGITHAWLIDSNGQIVAALSRTEINHSLATILGKQSMDFSQAIRQNLAAWQPDIAIQYLAAEPALLGKVGIYPNFYLLVSLDLTPALAERLALGRSLIWRQAGLILFFAALLAGFLHILWFRRAAHLTATARALGAGNLEARAHMQGKDELAAIGDALDNMAASQQRYQAELRQSFQHLETLANTSPALFWTSGLDKGCDWFNQRWLDFTGRSMAQEQGNGWAEGVHPDDFEHCLEIYLTAFDARAAFSMEYRLRRHDGEYRWLLDQGMPRYDADANFLGFIGSCMDISEEKQLQTKLVTSETHYRYLFEQNPAPMLIYERAGLQLVSVNEAFLRHYAYSLEEALSLRLLDLYPETEQAAIIDLAQNLQGHINVGEWHHRIKSGELINIIAHSHDLIYAEQVCRVAVITDITALKQVELALQQRNQELESFNAASVGRELTMIELKKQINELSKQLGRPRPCDLSLQVIDTLTIGEQKQLEQNVTKAKSQTQQQTMARLAILNQMQDANAARVAAETALAALSESEARMRVLINTIPDLIWLKDVDGVYLQCNAAFERFYGVPEADILGQTDYDFVDAELADFFRANDRRALEADDVSINEEWLTFAETGYRGLFQTVKTPVLDTEGHVVGVLGVARDITALRQAEEDLRVINTDLEARVAERTAELDVLNQSLESFVYSVSHDLKAPLRGIEGYSQFLQEDYAATLDEDGRLFIANIRNGVTRMGELIDDLLAYSRMERRKLDSNQLDLPAMINQLLAERADEFAARGVEIRTDLAAVWVQADASGLSIVMRNLLENALKFSARATPPRIEISVREENHSAIVKITDNGIGFDMTYHDRIFEIFQRLQRIEDYPGTGIGLALVKKAMQRMGGKVWAESEPGQGACFYLQLPVAKGDEE